jgi:hypothetical protein
MEAVTGSVEIISLGECREPNTTGYQWCYEWTHTLEPEGGGINLTLASSSGVKSFIPRKI